MEQRPSISDDVLGSYAADAAREVPGVAGTAERHLHRSRAVRVSEQDGALSVELHLAVEWGVSLADVGRAVQERVCEYLERMAGVVPSSVDVVVDEVAPPPAPA